MSFNPAEKFFSRDEHRRRIAAAIRRRLTPNTALAPKVLASAIGVTEHTILNWRNAHCDPGSFEIGNLFHYFLEVEQGPAFWVEVFGDIGDPMARRAELLRKRQEIEAELIEIEDRRA